MGKLAGTPEISIIVTCYDRKEFLLSALMSISRQDSPREIYEVIVVKNFADDEIDNFSKLQGYTSIITQTSSQGGLAAEGVIAARGRVLTFLDDDDLFDQAKISKVREYFSDDRVVFYHNAHRLIDEDGNPKPGYKLKPPGEAIKVTIGSRLNFKNVLKENRLYHLGTFYFNLSSISVLREVAFHKVRLLAQMESRPDDFIFFASLKSEGCTMIAGTEELTYYREHESASNPEGTREKLINLKRRHIMGSKIIADMMEGTPFEFLARSQLVIPKTDLCRLSHDLKGYLGMGFLYYKSQRQSSFPAVYILTNYLLGLLEAGKNPLFMRIRSKFLSAVGDIRS